MLPGSALIDCSFRVVGPFGPVIARFTGTRQDGRLCFEGYSTEDAEEWVWHPTADMIRECTLVARPR